MAHPKSLEEARAYKYNAWAGNPEGRRYREGHCAMEIYTDFRLFVQCSRKNGKGPAGLYCAQHAKKFSSPQPTIPQPESDEQKE